MLNNYDEKEWIFSYRIDGSAFIAACPYRSFRFWTCGEWEHGIFFKKSDCTTPDVIFLDLRSASINCVECPVSKRGLHTSVLSYTGGLISLRSYGNWWNRKQAPGILMHFQTCGSLIRGSCLLLSHYLYLNVLYFPFWIIPCYKFQDTFLWICLWLNWI